MKFAAAKTITRLVAPLKMGGCIVAHAFMDYIQWDLLPSTHAQSHFNN